MHTVLFSAMHCVSTLQMCTFVICEYCVLYCALCTTLSRDWCSNWGRRILTICEYCALSYVQPPQCTAVPIVAHCALCSKCALCTVLKLVHCVLCTVNCAVALCWNWGTVGTVHCAQTGAGGVGGLGARQASRSSSGKGKWTNLFGTQTISPPPLILRLHTKFTQLLIIHALAPA